MKEIVGLLPLEPLASVEDLQTVRIAIENVAQFGADFETSSGAAQIICDVYSGESNAIWAAVQGLIAQMRMQEEAVYEGLLMTDGAGRSGI